MNDKIDAKPANPPAFPRTAYDGKGETGSPFPHHEQDGMTLRDYFAATYPITLTEFLRGWKLTNGTSTPEALEAYADIRVSYADAMLKARQP
jgi:hypothetical protein